MGFDYQKLTTDPEYRARVMAEFKAKEAARVAAMSPEERADYERRAREAEEYENYLAEPVTMTRGELQAREDFFGQMLEEKVAEAEDRGFQEVLDTAKPHFDNARDERDAARADAERTHKNLAGALDELGHASAKAAHATRSQGGTDSKLTKALERIAELDAEVKKLTRERDAARLAYVELLDKVAKRG